MIGGCPACGAHNATCGQPSVLAGVDERTEEVKVTGPLKIYDVVMPNGVRTQMQLTDADAQRYRATPVERKPRMAPLAQQKARSDAPVVTSKEAPRRGRKPLPRDADGNVIREQG